MLTKLKPGDTARISLKHSQHLRENQNQSAAGGAMPPLVGVLAEWITASEIFNLVDKYNKTHEMGIKYQSANRDRIRKMTADKLKRMHTIFSSARSPKWDGSYYNLEGQKKSVHGDVAATSKYITGIFPRLRERAESSAGVVFNLAVENLNDHNITEWDIECTGQSDGGKESTADLIINKMDKNKVAKAFAVSLKTVVDDPSSTRGATIGPFQLIGDLIGLNNPQSPSLGGRYRPLLDNFPTDKYSSKVKDLVKECHDLYKNYDDHLEEIGRKEWKWKRGERNKHFTNWCIETYGYDAIHLGNKMWVRCFHEFSKDNKQEMIEKLFEKLDIKPDSPFLIATGEVEGNITTAIKSPSETIKKEWQKTIRTFDLRFEHEEERIGAMGLKWIFSINGKELPAIGGQMYNNATGHIQMGANADHVLKKTDVDELLETKFGINKSI